MTTSALNAKTPRLDVYPSYAALSIRVHKRVEPPSPTPSWRDTVVPGRLPMTVLVTGSLLPAW